MMKFHFKTELMSRQIQQQISVLYDLLDDNDDFKKIKHWLLNTSLGQNSNFLSFYYQLNVHLNIVRKDLNKLSEATEELQRIVNLCDNVVLIEQKNNKNLKEDYAKYYKKINKQNDNKRSSASTV